MVMTIMTIYVINVRKKDLKKNVKNAFLSKQIQNVCKRDKNVTLFSLFTCF